MSSGRIASFRRDGLVFDVRDTGPLDGVPVVLLHGFPQDSRSWDRLAPLLHRRGFRTLAPDLRGASPGARPRSRWAYRSSQLTADVVALIEQAGAGPVHLVGHDWGAAAAWSTAAARPDLVRTLTTLSVPHPAAFVQAVLTSSQVLKSWYMLAFQVPVLPELVLSRGAMRRQLIATGMSPDDATRDAVPMREKARARGGLNWYRGMAFTTPGRASASVRVPTLHVWSDGDTAIGPVGAALTPRYVDAPYIFEVLEGVSHWIPDEAPERVDALLGEHLAAYSQ
ncbi:pimeloyl-ACP methyl ester carboxylesterase [Rhodococcus sp. OK611]|uniref:alpha/beta fold hydrolase n=1 Tax=unclassified Rhodococcus (in: high G+C Gram-positive bacteria) TaxID=192944 RepID=UPI000BDAC5CD|nr:MULTISPECIES: alpha/beta fold hydrolase [unclassified Rhodococcus (in: high G+C Gram-positive bacteria)]PTR37466.1 pimeloyl-ACP methyl ester carboxylesterase [Rhodococcus sp. OK611]SNX93372.1 Pimeloyl-ACP methyl ester carboxylesterase [Rhodococcus sp. OK270]